MLLQVLIIKGCHSIGEKRSVDMYGMVTYCGPVVAYGGPCTSVVSWSSWMLLRTDVSMDRYVPCPALISILRCFFNSVFTCLWLHCPNSH